MITILAALYVFLFLWRMCRYARMFSDLAVGCRNGIAVSFSVQFREGIRFHRHHSICVAVVAV